METAPLTDAIADRGHVGARLGQPYAYTWVDWEPTSVTWESRADQIGVMGALIGVFAVVATGFALGGIEGFVIALFMFSGLGWLGKVVVDHHYRRDKEPVPREVRREACIEYADGRFFFVLAVDGKMEILQPWEEVREFERADYWPMFGDAGASPYKTGWHAIVMTPATGRPWLIASTIESEAVVRERFSALDAKFSAVARTKFMRAIESSKAINNRADSGLPTEL